MPVYAFVFMVFMLASVGLPGTSGFVGEFLILLGTFRVSTLECFLAATGVFLGAAYMLYLYRRVIFGTITRDDLRAMLDLNSREKVVFAPLIVLVLWMGIYPDSFLEPIRASVDHLVAQVSVPTHDAGASSRPAAPVRRSATVMHAVTAVRASRISPALPEIVLACAAMALLLIGVFRGEGSTRLVSWLAVAVADRDAGPGCGVFGRRAACRLLRHVHHRRLRRVHEGAGAARLGRQRSSWRLRFNEEHGIAALRISGADPARRRTGMMVMISANDLISLYLGLELQSLALYVVASFDRDFGALDRGRAQIFRPRRAGLGHAALRRLDGLRLRRHDRASPAWRRLFGARRGSVGGPHHRHRLRLGRPRLQGVGGAVPYVDARRL